MERGGSACQAIPEKLPDREVFEAPVELDFTLATRVPGAPDVPTLAESGYPGLEVLSWYGILAPAGTPQDIVRKLNADIVRRGKVLYKPLTREWVEKGEGDRSSRN